MAATEGPSIDRMLALGREIEAQKRMGELAQEWLLDHEFGRCSCSVTPGSCKGRQIIDEVGRMFYARYGRDKA